MIELATHFVRTIIKKFFPKKVFLHYFAHKWYEQQLNNIQSIEKTIKIIESRWNIYHHYVTDAPIFIFSAGWRSGSTLLQRLINSNSTILIWGEPFANSNLIQNQTNSLKAITNKYPRDTWFLSHLVEQSTTELILSQQVTDNLYPDVETLIEAHRNFWLNLYGSPAKKKGYNRWGLKEVRLTIEHAIYLKWLFPKAQFLFLYRNPYHAYQSLRNHIGKWNLYSHWPFKPVLNSEAFGYHWQNLMEGYLQDWEKVNGILVKYEDLLTNPVAIAAISEYLNLDLDEEVILNRIGSSKHKDTIPNSELNRLKKIVEPLAEKLGYLP